MGRVRGWAASLVDSLHANGQSEWTANDDPVVFLCWAAVSTKIAAELAREIYTLEPILHGTDPRAAALWQLARLEEDG